MHNPAAQFEEEYRSVLTRIRSLDEYCTSRGSGPDCSVCAKNDAAEGKRKCMEHVISELGEILLDLYEHFVRQEQYIKSAGIKELHTDHCFEHTEDHAEITDKLRLLISGVGEMTASEIIGALKSDIAAVLEVHENTLDQELRSFANERS